MKQERLRELLSYDPATGVFRWRVSRKGAREGSEAGYRCPHRDYVRITLDGRSYYAHRLAILYTDGFYSENEIDHINGDRADNRRENLREVSRSCNSFNSKTPSNNTSGRLGVCWSKTHSKWVARYGNKFLGSFHKFEEAVSAREKVEDEDICRRRASHEDTAVNS